MPEFWEDTSNEYPYTEAHANERTKMVTKKAPKKRAAKKVVTKKRAAKKPSTLLENLLQALAGFYPDDALTPGVVLAYLPHREGLLGNDRQYYGSIARFVRKPRLDGKSGSATFRFVIHKTFGPTPEDVIAEMAGKWYEEAMRPSKALAPFRLIRGGKK